MGVALIQMLQRSKAVTSINTLAVLVIGVPRMMPAQERTMCCYEKKNRSTNRGTVWLAAG